MKKLLVALLLLASAAAGYWLHQRIERQDTAPLPAGTIDFTLPDLEGMPRSASEWAGKGRLVNFWATWCAPCRREIPLLKKAQAEHAERVQVIGVAVDFEEDVREYAQAAEFNYPVLIGQDDAMAVVEAAGYDFVGLPMTMVVSAEGDLLKMHLGEIHEHQVEHIIDVLGRLDTGELDSDGARAALGRL